MKPKVPSNPFGKIALCCSGGGYRATAFHLGAMSYLNRIQYQGKPLLENVKAISTVSGGTFTGVVYAQGKQEGKTFEEIYSQLVNTLQKLDLVERGLEKLKLSGKWNNEKKRRNLINAFAEIYDDEFTNGATFGIFDDMSKSHLDEVIFNATEFDNGVAFRFQNHGFFGNKFYRVNDEERGEVRLSDIIAASSCFPGGFEPIGFPTDFQHKNSPNLKKMDNKEIGLMDGGIYDNQGIDSILLSEGRNKRRLGNEESYYDLIILTDVASPYISPYSFSKHHISDKYRNSNLESIQRKANGWSSMISWLLIIFLVIGVGVSVFFFKEPFLFGVGITISVISMISIIVFYFFKWKVNKEVNKLISFFTNLVPPFFQKRISELDFKKYTVGQIEPLIFDRVSSLRTMIEYIFLKQIRRLNYSRLYQPPEFKYRRISNLIKELTEYDFNSKEHGYQKLPSAPSFLIGDYQTVVGKKIQEVANKASSFGTTLWFTKSDEFQDTLDALLASGQMTMCYNLLVHLTELIYTPNNGYTSLPDDIRKELQNVFDQCIRDWKQFKNKDPLCLIN